MTPTPPGTSGDLCQRCLTNPCHCIPEGLRATLGGEHHYRCRICGGNPTDFPYKPDINFTTNGRTRRTPERKEAACSHAYGYPDGQRCVKCGKPKEAPGSTSHSLGPCKVHNVVLYTKEAPDEAGDIHHAVCKTLAEHRNAGITATADAIIAVIRPHLAPDKAALVVTKRLAYNCPNCEYIWAFEINVADMASPDTEVLDALAALEAELDMQVHNQLKREEGKLPDAYQLDVNISLGLWGKIDAILKARGR